MSSEEMIKAATEGVTELRQRLDSVMRNSHEEGDLDAARERLKRWKDRAIRILEDNISSEEAERLRKKSLGGYVRNAPWQNLDREANLYDGLLKALLEAIQDDPSIVHPSSSSALVDTAS